MRKIITSTYHNITASPPAMEDQQTTTQKAAAAAAAVVKRKSKLKSRGGGAGSGGRCDGTSVLEKVTAGNNDECITNIAPVTPGGHNTTTITDTSPIDLTNSTPAKKKASGAAYYDAGEEDHFFSSPVVEIVSKPKATTISTATGNGNNTNNKRKRVSTSPSALEVSSVGKEKNEHTVVEAKKKKTKKNLQTDTSDDKNSKQPVTKAENQTTTTKKDAAVTKAAVSKKTKSSSSPPQVEQPAAPNKKRKKRSFHDQILYTMLTSNKPYSLKSLAKATNTTVEQLNHAMLSFVDKGLVIVKEFPSKNNTTGKKLYWATTVTLSDHDCDNDKKKKGSEGAIQKELSKLGLATPREINETKQLYVTLEQRYRSIQEELQPLLAIPTMKELDDDIEKEEEKLKKIQDEIDQIRTRIREQSENKMTMQQQSQQRQPVAQYGSYYRMQQQQQRRSTTTTTPSDPATLKRKINHMLSEYKARKRKCMDFVNDLADAMEKHPREVMSNDKILGLDTDEMEWGWWLDCGSGKVFGTKPKKNKKLLGGGGQRQQQQQRHGAAREEEEEEKNEPTVKIPAKYMDV